MKQQARRYAGLDSPRQVCYLPSQKVTARAVQGSRFREEGNEHSPGLNPEPCVVTSDGEREERRATVRAVDKAAGSLARPGRHRRRCPRPGVRNVAPDAAAGPGRPGGCGLPGVLRSWIPPGRTGAAAGRHADRGPGPSPSAGGSIRRAPGRTGHRPGAFRRGQEAGSGPLGTAPRRGAADAPVGPGPARPGFTGGGLCDHTRGGNCRAADGANHHGVEGPEGGRGAANGSVSALALPDRLGASRILPRAQANCPGFPRPPERRIRFAAPVPAGDASRAGTTPASDPGCSTGHSLGPGALSPAAGPDAQKAPAGRDPDVGRRTRRQRDLHAGRPAPRRLASLAPGLRRRSRGPETARAAPGDPPDCPGPVGTIRVEAGARIASHRIPEGRENGSCRSTSITAKTADAG